MKLDIDTMNLRRALYQVCSEKEVDVVLKWYDYYRSAVFLQTTNQDDLWNEADRFFSSAQAILNENNLTEMTVRSYIAQARELFND